MANISLLSRLVNGIQRQVDLSANTLVVSDLQINGISLRSTGSGTAGSTGIGDDASYSHFTPTAATVKGALTGIDNALAGVTSNTANQTLSNLTSPTAINQDLLPATANARALGSNTKEWQKVWANEILSPGQIDFVLSTGLLYKSTGANVTNFESMLLNDGSSVLSINWASRLLADSAGATQLFWSTSGVSITNALAMGGNIDLNSHKIINSGAPTNPNDLATKAYVDNFINATSWKAPALVATTANITLSGEQTIDGVLTSASRVLVKNQTAPEENGIYVSAAGAWARAVDMDAWSEVPAAAVFVETGTAGADLGFVCTSNPGGTLGTTAINFVQFSSAGSYTADNTTLQLVTGVFSIKNAGVTETQIASSTLSATGALAGGSGTKLSVKVDNSTIEISSDQLQIKDAGVTAAKVGTGVADQVTITGGAGSALAVVKAPVLGSSEVAGEALSATTLVALRFAKAADAGFVAGRVYKADYDASSVDNFHAIGLAYPSSGVSAAGAVIVVEMGLINAPSHGFTVGAPVYLSASGAVTGTAPSTANQAVVILGYAKDANNIFVKTQIVGIN